MKIHFCLVLVFVSSIAIGQNRLGITASADYNSRYNKFEFSDDNFVYRAQPMLGNTIGINYSSQKKWYYHFEIGFYRTQFLENAFVARGRTGPNEALSYMFTRTETKLFVPFNFLFNFNKGPSKLFASIGVMPMLTTKGNREFIVVQGSEYYRNSYEYNLSSGSNRLALGGQFSVGLSQALSPTIELTVAPVFRTWISSATNFGTNYISFPISVGFNVGTYYKFNSKPKATK